MGKVRGVVELIGKLYSCVVAALCLCIDSIKSALASMRRDKNLYTEVPDYPESDDYDIDQLIINLEMALKRKRESR